MVKTNENQVQFDEKIQSQDGTNRSKWNIQYLVFGEQITNWLNQILR